MGNQKLIRFLSVTIGTIISILIVIIGFKMFQNAMTKAGGQAPHDVAISEINANSSKITWITDQETQGVIEYGTSPTALNFFAPEIKETLNHSVDLTLLSPNTTYYFQIRIGEEKYLMTGSKESNPNGVPWTFATKGVNGETKTPATLETQESETPSSSAPKTLSPQPSPAQVIRIPDSASSVATPTPNQVCNSLDCTKIESLLGKGCNASDLTKCYLKAANTTPTTAP